MEANIRQLKANLSALIRCVQAGDIVTVNVRKRPVARIVPIPRAGRLTELACIPGIIWTGGKPAGLPRGEVLRRSVNLGKWIAEDRR